ALQTKGDRRFGFRLAARGASGATFECLPKFVRAFAADSREQLGDGLEPQFVARVGSQLEICGHIFDVRLLEKPDATGDGEWNPLASQLQLQFERVEVGAIKDRDF